MVLGVLNGWLDRREREAIAYLIEENRLMRRQLGPRRLHFTDDDRRRLAVRAYRVRRTALREIATIATPTRCCAGTGSSLRGSGRTAESPEGAACGSRSGDWSSAWRRRIRRGATRGSKAR